LTVTYVTTPLEPGEQQYVRVRYVRRVSPSGTEVALSGSFSGTHPGAYLKRLDLEGESWFTSVSVLQPLHRRRDANLWLTGALELRDSRLDRGGTLRRHDRLFILRMGLNGNAAFAGGKLRGNVTAAHGIDALGATRTGDPNASRDDADATFATLIGWSDWTRPLSTRFSLRVATQAQVATQPLLIAEEIGLGGGAFLRGYDYSEKSGDQGYMGLAEIRYDWRNPLGFGRKAQLYGFVDGGRVTNLDRGFGGGALASGGGGVRADVSPTIDASFEVAVPLSAPRYETGDRRPRLNLRVLKVF
jgi:hemolysin activation/secretion protein